MYALIFFEDCILFMVFMVLYNFFVFYGTKLRDILLPISASFISIDNLNQIAELVEYDNKRCMVN